MIFVTVGTHEQQFDRLIRAIDELVGDRTINEEVIIQKGYSDYEPKHCKTYKLIGYKDMQKYIKDARIVITHGGPASFVAPLTLGKTPIVMPRQKKYGEHVNDHQLEFCKEVEKRYGNIIVVNNKAELKTAIENYGSRKIAKLSSNNTEFNKNILSIISSTREVIDE